MSDNSFAEDDDTSKKGTSDALSNDLAEDNIRTNDHQSPDGRRRKLSRRTYLAAAGATVVGLGSVGTATAARHTLEIVGVANYTSYSFAVSGEVRPERGIGGIDEADGHYAHGAVADGGTDVYTFTGDLIAFTFDGRIDVDLDGGPAHVGRRPDYLFEILATGPYTRYAFDVGSNLAAHEGIGGKDRIDGTHAEGAISGDGRDAYLFDGDLEAFSLDGRINAYLNGQPAHVGRRPESEFRYSNGGGSGGGDGGDGAASNADLELGYNARARSHEKGTTYENFEDGSRGWEAVSGRVESGADWQDPPNDSGSATLISEGDNDRVEMTTRTSSDNFAYRDLSMAVRLRDVSNETLRVELAAGDGSEFQTTTRYLSEKHGWVRIGLGPSAWSGTPDMADINEFSISCYTGAKECEIDVDDIRTTPKRDSGAVLFVFDDANRSDYTVAYDMMSDRGMAGTSAIIPRVVDGDSNKLTQSQIDEMDSAGWAWAAHPQRESVSGGLGSIPADEAEREMRETKQWLLDNTSGRGANTLVWPFGDFDADALNIAGDYFDLSFGGGSSVSNGTLTEASWVPRVNTDDVENALDAIDHAYKTDTVCVLMAHGLGGSRLPASDFRRLLDRVESRGLDVLTTADFAAEQ
ncbi:polysaccharide deacetylase family protein [Halococcus sediminicola]|uniref:polysaccharide deacetylase family protein n=1 Tax=Halococcus sediminicola TaxID=1264579 RepID=UPI000678B5EA|nr:polysaccharide deacetylase family protein [Halococcus sediminicola]